MPVQWGLPVPRAPGPPLARGDVQADVPPAAAAEPEGAACLYLETGGDTMTGYICVNCGVQYAPADRPPASCPICTDEREFIRWGGQAWTTLETLQEGHQNVLTPLEPGLTGIGTQPAFAIGQRALLVQTPTGNVLWDCISLIDETTVGAVEALGGIAAIAISHPHFYASMVEWSRAFHAPIYLHADARRWVMRPDPAIHWWEGDTRSVVPGLTLVRCGGHFASSAVLHWANGADGRGSLLTGDTMSVALDRRYVTFMRSYPNLIPLPAAAVRRIAAAVEPFPFDRIYGGWWDYVVSTEAKAAVARSAARYVAALEDRRGS